MHVDGWKVTVFCIFFNGLNDGLSARNNYMDKNRPVIPQILFEMLTSSLPGHIHSALRTFFFFYWSGSDTFCGGVELSLFHFPSPPSHGLSHIPWVMVLLTLGTTEADSHTDKSRYKGTKSRYKGTKLTASCQEQTKLHNSKNHLQVETSLLSVCAQSWSFEEQVRGCNKGEDAGQSGARQSGQSAQWAAEFNKNCGEF